MRGDCYKLLHATTLATLVVYICWRGARLAYMEGRVGSLLRAFFLSVCLCEGRSVERARVAPIIDLRSDTKYLIGVVSFVDHGPHYVYKHSTRTVSTPGVEWEEKPTVIKEGVHHFLVCWKIPDVKERIENCIVEYRLRNEAELANIC